MDIQEIILALLSDFPILTTLLSTILFGEEIVIILGFLSGLGLLPLWILLVFGLMGTFLSDLLWFIVGKTIFKERQRRGRLHRHYHRFMRRLDRIAFHNHFVSLLLTRFFYFFRLLAIVHLSRRGLPAKKFVLYEIPIIALWLAIFVSLGWFFGNTTLAYLDIFTDFQIIIGIVLVFLLVFIVAKSLVRFFFERKTR